MVPWSSVDDVINRNELAEDIFVSRTVLQCQEIGVFPDQAAVSAERRTGEQRFDEQDDQVHLRQPGGIGHGFRMVDMVFSAFLQPDSLLVDCPDDLRIGIHKVDFIVQCQVAAVYGSHGTGADHGYSHFMLVPFCICSVRSDQVLHCVRDDTECPVSFGSRRPKSLCSG